MCEMYFRVYSHWFDYSKNRYAYNDLLFGYQKSGRKHEGSATFRLFSSEVEKVLNIADLTTTTNSHNIDGDGSDPAANDLEQSPKRVRMERQEQEIVILSVRARESGMPD